MAELNIDANVDGVGNPFYLLCNELVTLFESENNGWDFQGKGFCAGLGGLRLGQSPL